MLTIDGTQGEGGGQILRTALALAVVTGQPCRIYNIRAKRPQPGLARQHLASVKAAAEVSAAEVSGDKLGSRDLVFRPGRLRPGRYNFSIGSAGSTSLVLQTVLPPLLAADGPSHVTLEGGTHNPWAPPLEFLQRAFVPLLVRMGARIDVRLVRHGFYPAGGGLVEVDIRPPSAGVDGRPRWSRLDLPDRGEIVARRAVAVVSRLPASIARRELDVAARRLEIPAAELHVVEAAEPRGPGNALAIEIECRHVTEVFAGIGRRGVPAEQVAGQACDAAERYLAAGVPVGEHLADQLVLPLALAGAGGFRTLPLSSHARTNIDVIQMFLAARLAVAPAPGGVEVRVEA